MRILEYQGYRASVEPDIDAGILFGRVLDVTTVITFAAERVDEIVERFHEAIDDYIEWCQEDGIEPEAPRPMPQQAAS
jgi:predicted HicB family RNase H-like nuclease